MFDYLQQFQRLPQNLRDQVSAPSVMTAISDLEKKYRLDLAITVMKVMIKAVTIKNLPGHLSEEFSLSDDQARQLAEEMKEKVFRSVADYLGFGPERRTWDLHQDIEKIISAAGLTISSQILVSRFKNILATYLRGVRNKIDTKNSLAKDVKIGGLNLSPEEIDRVMKVCASQSISGLEQFSTSVTPGSSTEAGATTPFSSQSPGISSPITATRLDKIMAGADQGGAYDLKKEVSSGRLAGRTALDSLSMKSRVGQPEPNKLPSSTAIDNAHQISPPADHLDLPAPARAKQISSPKPGALLTGQDGKSAAVSKTDVLSSKPVDSSDKLSGPAISSQPPTPPAPIPRSFEPPSSSQSVQAVKPGGQSAATQPRKASSLSQINQAQPVQSPASQKPIIRPSSLPPQSSPKVAAPAAVNQKKSFWPFLSFKSSPKPKISALTPPLPTAPQSVPQPITKISPSSVSKPVTPAKDTVESTISPNVSAAIRPSVPVQAPVAPPIPTAPRPQPTVPAAGPSTVKTGSPIPAPVKPTPASHRPSPPASSARPQIHDIKPMPKVMGPLEELQFLDPINFRRLSDDPIQAVNKIFAKIKLLEKDGYDKMILGVKAWRQSPVNRLYIQLGQEAVKTGQTLSAVLNKQAKDSPRSLSQAEVNAISGLNSKLIF